MTNDKNGTMKTPIQALDDRRRQQGDRVAMVQPLGGDKVRSYTWEEVADEAYRMAGYLQAQGVQTGDRVALVSKNCAEWIMADLAIWIAGGVSVPLYPTLVADSVKLILEHSESKILFVGKLDDWDMMKDGLPLTSNRSPFPWPRTRCSPRHRCGPTSSPNRLPCRSRRTLARRISPPSSIPPAPPACPRA